MFIRQGNHPYKQRYTEQNGRGISFVSSHGKQARKSELSTVSQPNGRIPLMGPDVG